MSEFGKDINAHSRKGVFIPDITVEMFRNASLEGVEDLMASGEMEDIVLPSAQPEIIRCKDCEWWTQQKDSIQGRCALMQMYPTGEWFCGNAQERGTDE